MDTERQDYLRKTALESLGPGHYDRLVVSVSDARRLGRLRYWQEQLLARIPGCTVGLEDFIAVFDGAPLQHPPAQAPGQPDGVTSQPDWKKNAPVWVQEDREMNEAEWSVDQPLIYMISFLILRSNDRRHLLFGCACCRQVWDRLKMDAAKRLVELAERFADGEVSESEFYAGADISKFPTLEWQCTGQAEPEAQAQLSACELSAINGALCLCERNYRMSHGAYGVAQGTCADVKYDYIPSRERPFGGKIGVPPDRAEFAKRVPLLRDIFGNPFSPVAFAPEWRTSTAMSLARRMYESREFGAMAILADALQDAGCNNNDILDHCRGPGSHVRGCWVVDLVLDKR